MSSRDDILRSIRGQLPQSSPLPQASEDWIQYENLQQQFAEVLESVGGECHVVSSVAEIPDLLGELTSDEHLVVSRVPNLLEDRSSLTQFSDPHDLQDVHLAILPGQLAVAENAAVWVQTGDLLERTLHFICQHLVLVVPLDGLRHNMHEAYQQISIDAASFGTFISGPSKTADIEQSLVKGAHGARTLKVFLVESSH